MKKIVTVILVCFCFSPVFAQGEKTAAEIATGKVGTEIARQVQAGASQAARAEQAVRFMDVGTALRYTDNAMQLSELEAARVPEVADLSAASNVQNTLENASKESLHLQEKLANLKRVIWKKRATELFSPSAPRIKITNMPGEPTVKLGGAVDNAPAVLSARLLPSVDRWNIINPTDPVGVYTEQIFLPKDILENKESFYRGMRLEKLDDVKNLLINGLEAHRTNYHGDIYASLMPSIALWHAIMAGKNLSVLVQIPATDKLRSYAPEAFPTDDRYAAKAFQTGEVCIFRRDVPASFISNIWVFLEVNGNPGWYKATLENDELIFTPVPAAYLKKKN